MLEKNSKISVLRKMIGIDDEPEPNSIAPPNSLTNIRHRLGLCEMDTPAGLTPPALLTNAFALTGRKADAECPHCENMAKNFLYLESLLRSNYNPRGNCSLCYSALRYLQYVNKSIKDVFSHSKAIQEAAKTFSLNLKHGMPKRKSRKLQSRSTLIATTDLRPGALVKKMSRIPDASKHSLKITAKPKSKNVKIVKNVKSATAPRKQKSRATLSSSKTNNKRAKPLKHSKSSVVNSGKRKANVPKIFPTGTQGKIPQ